MNIRDMFMFVKSGSQYASYGYERTAVGFKSFIHVMFTEYHTDISEAERTYG